MKENEFYENTGKVFKSEFFNQESVGANKKVAYSEDGDYVLVYTDRDIENLHDLWGFREYDEYIWNRSVEDEIFDCYLEEFELEEMKYKNYKNINKKILDDEKVIEFRIDGQFLGCLINVNDSETKGSDILLLIGHNSETVLTCTIVETGNDEGVEEDE